jgi:hypothetical protein
MNGDIFGKWDETFRIACNALSDTLVVEVRNRSAAALGSLGSVVSGKSDDVVIGRCQLPLSSLLTGAPVNGWFALDSGGGVKLGLKLVSSTPGSVPATYAVTPLPVLAAAPGEFAVVLCDGFGLDGCTRPCLQLQVATAVLLCPSHVQSLS